MTSTRQSAAKCYRGPITKQGNKQARWMLIQSAQVVARQGGSVGHFLKRLNRLPRGSNVWLITTADETPARACVIDVCRANLCTLAFAGCHRAIGPSC
jgi:hypothetical protein